MKGVAGKLRALGFDEGVVAEVVGRRHLGLNLASAKRNTL